MAWYRVYFLSSFGHIERTKEIQCSNDAEAIATLDSEGRHAELWQRDRFIRSIDAFIGADLARSHSLVERASGADND